MAHGQPDFGMYAPKETVFGQADLAEAVARLGGMSTFDRRGDVVWLEDFSNGSTNWTLVNNTSETATVVGTETLTSGFSLRLLANTDPTSLVGIVREDPLPVNSRIGMEFAFLPDANVQDVRVDLVLYDGTTFYAAYVFASLDAKTITYYDAAGNWVELASGVNLRQDGKCWHVMKVVFDLATKKYVRLILDNVEYDVSSLGLFSAASAAAPMLEATIKQLANSAAGSPNCHITNIICTQNEP